MPKKYSKQKTSKIFTLQSNSEQIVAKQEYSLPFNTLIEAQNQKKMICQNEQLEAKRNLEIRKQGREANYFAQANQQRNSFPQQKHVYFIKQEASDHFNVPLVQENQLINSKRISFRKKKNSRKSQNLKNISKYMMLLITNNTNLSVKEISYLLFEMIGQTRFGMEIVQQRFPIISNGVKRQLAIKYSDETNAQADARNLIKNVRRRLYDALNVLVSSKIIYKYNKLLQVSRVNAIVYKPNQQNMSIQQVDKKAQKLSLTSSKQNYINQIKQAKKRLKKKREMLQMIKQKYALIKALVQQNKANHSQPLLVFPLPLVLIKTDPSMVVEVGKQDVVVRNYTQANLLGDFEILKIAVYSRMEVRTQSSGQEIENEIEASKM